MMAFSSMETSAQLLVLEMGRTSLMVTASPSLHSLFASCACTLEERVMYLPYTGCFTRRSTSTTMDLSILLLTTRPETTRPDFSTVISLADIFRTQLSAFQ